MIIVWIVVCVAVIGVGVVVAVRRERRTGRRVAPGAVHQRRDDAFRMRTGAHLYQSRMPEKDPKRR